MSFEWKMHSTDVVMQRLLGLSVRRRWKSGHCPVRQLEKYTSLSLHISFTFRKYTTKYWMLALIINSNWDHNPGIPLFHPGIRDWYHRDPEIPKNRRKTELHFHMLTNCDIVSIYLHVDIARQLYTLRPCLVKLLYGCESWPLTVDLERRIQAIWKQMLQEDTWHIIQGT